MRGCGAATRWPRTLALKSRQDCIRNRKNCPMLMPLHLPGPSHTSCHSVVSLETARRGTGRRGMQGERGPATRPGRSCARRPSSLTFRVGKEARNLLLQLVRQLIGVERRPIAHRRDCDCEVPGVNNAGIGRPQAIERECPAAVAEEGEACGEPPAGTGRRSGAAGRRPHSHASARAAHKGGGPPQTSVPRGQLEGPCKIWAAAGGATVTPAVRGLDVLRAF